MKVIATLRTLHDAVFGAIERLAEGWFLGFAARFVFAAVLLVYFVNSALLKFEGGPFSFSFGAYIQILTEQGAGGL